MTLTVFSGSANRPLAEAVAARLGVRLGAGQVCRFPDGELHVEIQESVRGHEVFLVQPTAPPVETHVFELLFLADACRRAGAARLTGVVPYFGYARQDRRASGREAIGARVVADLLATGGGRLDRLVAVDLHSAALEGVFPLPLEHLSAVPSLADAVRPFAGSDGVIVAPDLGAARLADRYARSLGLPVALVHKTRLSGREVSVRGVTGEVRGRVPIVVDDMISTGGTVAAAVGALLAAGSGTEVTVVATHALLVAGAVERLRALGLGRMIVTDTVAAAGTAGAPAPLQVVTVAPLLAEAINRLYHNRSLGDLIAHG